MKKLSRPGRAYVLAVIALGGGLILSSLIRLALDTTTPYWVIVAALALFSAPLSIRVPSMRATVTVTATFVFAAALLFGPAAATLTIALDGLLVSYWAKRRNLHRALFNIGEPAISIFVAAQLFYLVFGVQPLFGSPVGLGELLVPLLLMTTSYFVINSVLCATVVWFETRANPVAFLRDQLLHTGINYFASCSVVVLLVLNLDNLTFAAVGVFVPVLVLSYASSRLSTARVEATNRHLNELRQLYLSIIKALALAIDAKDQVTSGHIRRVQRHSVALARELGITDGHQINAIEAAALLHDLGKLGMPEHILNKPGKLTPVEFEQMKTHAAIGADILATIDFPYPVEPIVRHHHEMWDGKGYPEGIRGEDIPIGARILSVVDCFDALTSDRPYRLALTPEQATAVLIHQRGTQYDPRVVDAFIAVCHRRNDVAGGSERSEMESGRQADGHEKVTPRLQLGEVDLPEPSAGLDEGAGLDHRVYSARVDDEGCMLPTFDVISRYLETVASGAVCVLYNHEVDQARLVFAHTSSPEHECLLRDVSMPLGDRLTGWVGANRRAILNSDPALDLGELAAAWCPRLQTGFAMPLIVNDTLLGVFSVYSPDQQGFSHQQAQTLTLLVREGLEQIPDDVVAVPAHRSRPLPVLRPRIFAVPA